MASELSPTECIELLLRGSRLVDVRSEVEFERANLPWSVNRPLLTTAERVEVGTLYRAEGQDSAISRGHELVSGSTRAVRTMGWRSEFQFEGTASPAAAVMCARGGLRSAIVRDWLGAEGVHVPRVAGGYKAVREALSVETTRLTESLELLVVNGRTGVGKTDVLHHIAPVRPVLDLEGLANHRGSVYGACAGGQPGQATFENTLNLALIGLSRRADGPVLVEAESQRVGECVIPDLLFGRLRSSPMVILELPIDERITNIARGYVFGPIAAGEPSTDVRERLLRATASISKRLGGERFATVTRLIEFAFEPAAVHSIEAHREWIRILLEEYYDPLYERHLARHGARVVRSFLPDEFVEWMRDADPRREFPEIVSA